MRPIFDREPPRSFARSPSRGSIVFAVGVAACALAFLLWSILCGCTIAPRPIVATQASFDGTNQNSGILGVILQDGTILTGAPALANRMPIAFTIIGESARARYNALVERYGKTFLVPIGPDFGVTLMVSEGLGAEPIRFSMTAEAVADFAKMERFYKAGK